MIPPELQSRDFRPYISSSASSPSFPSSFTGDQNPNPSTSSFYYGGATSRSRRSSSSMKNSRFAPSSFVHNAKIVVALVPSVAFLLDLGGTPVVATLVVGLMVAYILDSLNFKSGSFFALWFSLIAAQISFFFSLSLYNTLNNYISLAFSTGCTPFLDYHR